MEQAKASPKILHKYIDYINIFLFNSILNLPKNTDIYKYVIK